MMGVYKNQSPLWSVLLLALRLLAWLQASHGLSTTKATLKRPMVSLTGEGDVSGFLYGKLQRATSIYGSGMVGPATAIVHGQQDLSELLPRKISTIASPQRQLKDLEKMLWNQFGMATCEGSVEREDLLTPMSYLKPKLCELQDTLVFLDATTTSMNSGKGNGGGGGLGGLFSSILSNKKGPQQQSQQQTQGQQQKAPSKDCWVDLDLVRSAVTRGSGIFVVCESQDTDDCARALADCMLSLGQEANKSIVTLVSPDDNVELGALDGWNSLRPQDLEGELSKTISVRDGTADSLSQWQQNEEEEEEEDVKPTFKRTREERLAAAYSEDPPPQKPTPKENKGSEARIAASKDYKPPSTLSMHDLAEVCVQCALRLPIHDEFASSQVRVVRVSPLEETEEEGHEATKRPNSDYFTLTGGPKAKAKAGVVSSVDWTRTLSCFASGGAAKEFPKRPDVA